MMSKVLLRLQRDYSISRILLLNFSEMNKLITQICVQNVTKYYATGIIERKKQQQNEFDRHH